MNFFNWLREKRRKRRRRKIFRAKNSSRTGCTPEQGSKTFLRDLLTRSRFTYPLNSGGACTYKGNIYAEQGAREVRYCLKLGWMERGWMVAQIKIASHQFEWDLWARDVRRSRSISSKLWSSRSTKIIARGKSPIPPLFFFLSFFLQRKVERRSS